MKKLIGIFIFLLVVFGSVWFWWSYYYTYSDGNRTGILQKFSHKGNLFKTYEGELVMSGIVLGNGGPVSSEKFYFSVNDKRLGEMMRDMEGKRVTVMYKQKKGTLPWRGDSDYIVDSIKVIE